MQRRGWIIFPDGRPEELPLHILDHEHISWPPTMQVKEPAEPVRYWTTKDMYRRHEVVEGQAYVFLQDSDQLAEVPADILAWVKEQLSE